MKNRFHILAVALPIMTTVAMPAFAKETLRIATIESLTGSFAPLGSNRLETFQFMANLATTEQWAGPGYEFDVVGFDGKASPQESLIQLKRAIDQGYRYIGTGNGSHVALALVDAVNKHNARNPGKEVIVLNYPAIDPDLSNSKCSFYAFHFDSNTNGKMEVMTTHIAENQAIKKVYIIGQDYSHGHLVSKVARENLTRKRPDIDIVGDDLHPVGSVKDFSPYAAKIKASGADSVITGNWGTDLTMLIKATREAGVDVKFFTYYANDLGNPKTIGASGENMVKMVNNWHSNADYATEEGRAAAYKKKYGEDLYLQYQESVIGMLAQAVKKTNSLDPLKNAFAMEDMTFQAMHGLVKMRKDDHLIQQPLYIATWTKTDGTELKYDQGDTGYGWKTEQKLDASVATQPTTCKMKRPPQ